MDIPGKKWILGNTFLRRYYSIYDDDNKRIGLVRSLHAGEVNGDVKPENLIFRTKRRETRDDEEMEQGNSSPSALPPVGRDLVLVDFGFAVYEQRSASGDQSCLSELQQTHSCLKNISWTGEAKL